MKVGGFVIGLLLAFVGHFLALLIAGAGHGWTTPLWASFLLWIALPATFATVSPLGRQRFGGKQDLLALVAVAIAADAALIWATIREGTQYFWAVMETATPYPVLWLGIWGSWQLLVLVALIKGPSRENIVKGELAK